MLKNGGLALVRKVNIVFCGGGTGGHYYPLMAIKQELDKRLKDKNMYYIGSKYGIESQKIISENLENLLIPIRGLNRSFSIKNLVNSFFLLFELFFGFIRVFIFFLKNKPNLIIATGGYSSFLPLQVARIFNISYFLHEQNSFPGVVTRLFGSKAKIVFLGFDNTKTYLKKSNTVFSGNPLHSKSYKDISLNIDHNKRVLLIVGGSQGSEFLNNLVLEGIKKNVIPDINLIWLVGKNNFSKYEEYNNSSINVLSFVENAENHQYYNAKVLEENFASIIMQEKDITGEALFKKINEIFTNEKIYSSMRKNIKEMNKPNSLKIITDNILEHLHAN